MAGIQAETPVQKAICAAIIELMETCDYQQITVSSIARKAGIARSSFYRYYDSVADAVEAMEEEFLAAIDGVNRIALRCSHGDDEALSHSMLERMEIVVQYRDFLLAVDGPHGDPSFHERSEEMLSRYLRARLSERGLQETELELYLSYAMAGHYRMVHTWLSEYPSLSAEYVATFMNRLLYSAFHA